MLVHLSTPTRLYIRKLLAGKPTELGGETISQLNESGRRLLQVLAINLINLNERKGADLTNEVETLFVDLPELDIGEDAEVTTLQKSQKRLRRIRTNSFRGIAPAGQDWEFDFEGKSSLLHGPNGSGKSSLFGAICWALTGKLLRDDGPPSVPEMVPCYSRSKKPKSQQSFPNALTLLTPDGNLSSPSAVYVVDLELESSTDSNDRIWLRRHSVDGLLKSTDGKTWLSAVTIRDVGISELDVELHVLVPARVGHMRFGKDAQILTLFSQIVGLDDLELIADLAGKCQTGFTKDANRIEKDEIKGLVSVMSAVSDAIERNSSDYIKELEGYLAAIEPSRTSESIKVFGIAIANRITALAQQLTEDLDIVVSTSEDLGSAENRRDLDRLPGYIDIATVALEEPLSSLLPKSIGTAARTIEDLESEQKNLQQFLERATQQVAERLDWAIRETQLPKANLMLLAAEHLSGDIEECPLCMQDLAPVPAVSSILRELQSSAGQSHLKQSIADLERELIAELDEIVPGTRLPGATILLQERLLSDWNKLRESRFLGLVAKVAERYDGQFHEMVSEIASSSNDVPSLLNDRHREAFSDSFPQLQKALSNGYLAHKLSRQRTRYDALLNSTLTAMLQEGDNSLSGILRRGAETNHLIKELASTKTQLQTLYSNQSKLEQLKLRVAFLGCLAQDSISIKALGERVRQETIDVVKLVEPTMKAYYEKLYDTEHLSLDLITPGHAANPAVKDEFNVYYKVGDSRLPASPFANAGRLRALALCFAFALHQRSEGTIAFDLLDDPALSLDDEHKARFVDHLLGDRIAKGQVLLATHYEKFFRCAELRFGGGVCLQLVPRRTTSDSVAFEPSDLLQRVDRALNARSTMWREIGLNIRRWGERTLAALSGYCPIPFVIFNNIPDSVQAYADIKDHRIATVRRDKIINALQSPQFRSVVHKLAHDEVVVEADVRDAYTALSKCRKDVDAELERLQEIHKHQLLKRGIEARPILSLLQTDMRFAKKVIEIAGHAAAASNGVGVTWIEPESMSLAEHPAIIVRTNALSPIAMIGQIGLLDPSDNDPEDGDLVAVRFDNNAKYLRRFWRQDGQLNLEGTNPTTPFQPVLLPANQCEIRRVVGMLFDGITSKPSTVGDEWAVPGSGVGRSIFDGVVGLYVDGTSLEPVARNGQIVLVRKIDSAHTIANGELACIDIEDLGVVLKRCYTIGKQMVLCPVNPVAVEEPILIQLTEIMHAYRIVGVLFENVN